MKLGIRRSSHERRNQLAVERLDSETRRTTPTHDGRRPVKKWLPLVVLALAQFLMVLDQAVMNVAISQLVEDFDTSVPTIQGVITL